MTGRSHAVRRQIHVSAETACEKLHKASPRKRLGRGSQESDDPGRYSPICGELWQALADTNQAAKHAKAAYAHAWADGEPYVRKHDLDRATTLLQELGEDIPALPTYDPARYPGKPWEGEIAAAISKLRKSKRSKT